MKITREDFLATAVNNLFRNEWSSLLNYSQAILKAKQDLKLTPKHLKELSEKGEVEVEYK